MIIGCLGEVIVDYIGVEGKLLADTRAFRQCQGGAAANVAVGLRALGMEPVLLSRVGNDPAGRFLREELERAGIDTRRLSIDPDRPTRRCFIAYDADGRREVDIVHRQSADQSLRIEEVSDVPIDALHVIGTAFLGEVTGATALALADRVRAAGGWVSFDPNIPLDRIAPAAQQRLVEFMDRVDVLACGPAEWAWLERHAAPAPTLLVRTDGPRGAVLSTAGTVVSIPPPQVPCIDPTGAGDAFMAGCLSVLAAMDLTARVLVAEDLHRAGAAGAALAARVIQHVGATTAYRA